ncbi:MAG: hypothetical protein V4663_05990 [Bacteroidota bacterium]
MENIQDSLQKVTLKEIAQTPFAFALYIITMVLLAVITTQRIDANKDKEDSNKKIQELEASVKIERKEKDEVFKAYLVERSANKLIQQTVDSTAIKNNRKP